MCGIVGIWSNQANTIEALGKAVGLLHHRGPDDSGLWTEPDTGMSLGHARLSILDLSTAGHQPMPSQCGRYVIVFNGEIYNHLALRKELGDEVSAWRGHSDTETLLACFSAWGVEKTLRATVGMFAIALWDRQTRKLVLARDRLGEKPLYFGYVAGAFAFASELKAFTVLPGFRREINRGALALLLRFNNVPAPYCIYEGLAKLLPGNWLEITAEDVTQRRFARPTQYWSALEAAVAGVDNAVVFDSDKEAAAALESTLSRSVADQMLSDVPLGAFLSGGVDSSTVVALMQAQSMRPVKTFTIGFREDGYDEAQYAASVARHLGTEHTELYVSSRDALSIIPNLSAIYDEPFADSSQIPTYLVAQLARGRVTVALSGDGGDELFGGYTRYFLAAQLWSSIERLPRALRRFVANSILALPPQVWDKLYGLVAPLIPQLYRWAAPGDKLHKGASLLGAEHGVALYEGLVSHWRSPIPVLESAELSTVLSGPHPALATLSEQMMLLDALSYLPDDILVKVDRAAMAVGLETRVPLIDHRVFEFAWRLPLHYKLRDGKGKWLLREVLHKYVPNELVDRPKKGFSVPIDIWLRGPLRDWAETLLNEARLQQEGFFHPKVIRTKWQEHLTGTRNWQYYLWDVLMFQSWLEHNH